MKRKTAIALQTVFGHGAWPVSEQLLESQTVLEPSGPGYSRRTGPSRRTTIQNFRFALRALFFARSRSFPGIACAATLGQESVCFFLFAEIFVGCNRQYGIAELCKYGAD
ncbi:MAG: hypothetical protein J6C37_00650 [Roseburia sp.]|nr:hypothetical protein [Roseburia sp.]